MKKVTRIPRLRAKLIHILSAILLVAFCASLVLVHGPTPQSKSADRGARYESALPAVTVTESTRFSLGGQGWQHSKHRIPPEIAKLEPALQAFARRGGEEEIAVIIQFADNISSGNGDSASALKIEDAKAIQDRTRVIFDTGGIPEMSYSRIPIQTAKVTPATLMRLVQDPRVARISVNHPVQGSLGRTARAVGATQVWNGKNSVTGKNAVVAVIDSGVSTDHFCEDLSGDTRVAMSFIAGATDAADAYGHGTHVAGIITGSGKNSGLKN
ncbi:MAG: S8 family serine peptidase, partial [Acidobacteriota bacterium]